MHAFIRFYCTRPLHIQSYFEGSLHPVLCHVMMGHYCCCKDHFSHPTPLVFSCSTHFPPILTMPKHVARRSMQYHGWWTPHSHQVKIHQQWTTDKHNMTAMALEWEWSKNRYLEQFLSVFSLESHQIECWLLLLLGLTQARNKWCRSPGTLPSNVIEQEEAIPDVIDEQLLRERMTEMKLCWGASRTLHPLYITSSSVYPLSLNLCQY